MIKNETTPPPSKEIFLPILQTLAAQTDANGTHHLAGKILTDGGSPVFEAGFLVSKKIFLSDPIRITAHARKQCNTVSRFNQRAFPQHNLLLPCLCGQRELAKTGEP